MMMGGTDEPFCACATLHKINETSAGTFIVDDKKTWKTILFNIKDTFFNLITVKVASCCFSAVQQLSSRPIPLSAAACHNHSNTHKCM